MLHHHHHHKAYARNASQSTSQSDQVGEGSSNAGRRLSVEAWYDDRGLLLPLPQVLERALLKPGSKQEDGARHVLGRVQPLNACPYNCSTRGWCAKDVNNNRCGV